MSVLGRMVGCIIKKDKRLLWDRILVECATDISSTTMKSDYF